MMFQRLASLSLVLSVALVAEVERYTIPRASVPLKDHPLRYEQPWQTGPYCGANSLFLFLNLSGVKAPVDELRTKVPVTARGASLADLKTAAEERGLHVEVMKSPPAGLRTQPLPFIALMGEDVEIDSGHYIVVCEIDDEGVWAIDGTNGSVVGLPNGTFNRLFSGYFLSHRPNGVFNHSATVHSMRLALKWFCAGEAVLLIALTGWWSLRRLRAGVAQNNR